MPRLAVFIFFTVLISLHGSAWGQDQAFEQAVSLQKVIQRVIARAEPSIACILVSRAEPGRRGGHLPSGELPGKPGDFDPQRFPGDDKARDDRGGSDLADPNHVPEAFGSGVVIDPQGLVLTNYHVVRDATRVFLRLPGGKAGFAEVHAADPRSDLAVLRLVEKAALPLSALPLGEGGPVERGQFVVTLANPFAAGFRDGQPSASWGIVSSLRRRIPGEPREDHRVKPLHHYGTLLQTDTRIHLGASGGALLNLHGELIGLTTALAAIHGGEAPGGFAIPLDAGMRRIVDVLKRGEEVEYGFLGVQVNDQRATFGNGVALANVIPGSPAEQDGHLRQDDIILAVNDLPIKESDDLFLHLGTQLAGAKVRLKVRHAGGGVAAVDVTLGKFHVPGKKIATSLGARPFFRGLRVDYTTLLAQQQVRLPIPRGVLVSDVQAGTAAAMAQLKVGEVITHVNQRPVTSPASFYRLVSTLQGPLELQLSNFGSPDLPPKVTLR